MDILLFIFTLLFLQNIKDVNAEGYVCPYKPLGYDGKNMLLYDYYNDNDGTFWTRKGETGWQTITDYCRQKGDISIHSDAGEWKCNDSKNICKWNGKSCLRNRRRRADCRALCQAVLDGKGPQCLGNCSTGKQSNNLYDLYCPP